MAGAQKKFYGVRVGARPGVYTNWADCQRQINGWKGAVYKSFLTPRDAHAFVAGETPPASADAKQKGPRFYGVAAGHKTGVFTDWSEVTPLIDGYQGPAYKKFETREAAAEFVANYKKGNSKKRPLKGAAKHNAEYEDKDEHEHDVEELFAELAEQPALKKTKSEPVSDTGAKRSNTELKIYTDGSSRGNGQVGACAGVGVWFGLNDPRNISERLAGLPQTNQRAELTALLRALQVCNHIGPIRIISDSKYSISCVTDWYKNWERNGWKTAQGPVRNKDLVVAVLEEQDRLKSLGGSVVYEWVKGHASSEGNHNADALAVAGSMKPLPSSLSVVQSVRSILSN